MLGRIADLFSNKASPALIASMYVRTPQSLVDRVALSKFRATVRWAAERSPFYRRAFREHGIDWRKVRRPADLGEFYTTPDQLADCPEDFLCERPNLVFESSGTSGRNKKVYYSREEWEQVGRTVAAGFRLMGIGPEDRVANAFDFSIWIPGLLCHAGVMANGNFSQAFGKVDPVEVYRRLAEHKINVVMGEPTWLIRLTQIAEREGPLPLKLIVGGAEEMPAQAIPWLEKVWAPAKVKMCYASVEMAVSMGFQPCASQQGYHLDTVDFMPEIIEPDAEGFGELAFTTLSRRTMPLIRYRTRDVTRLTPGGCACGLPAPHIDKLRGRRDELVVASGGNLYPLMFERIMKGISGLTFDWQVRFTLEGVREVMEVHVESQRTDREIIEHEFHQRATELYPDLMKNLAIGIFDMRIIVHRPGEVRATRKLKRLIDQRHAPATQAPQPIPTPAEAHG
jgi:phenylacetate-CoA ligase